MAPPEHDAAHFSPLRFGLQANGALRLRFDDAVVGQLHELDFDLTIHAERELVMCRGEPSRLTFSAQRLDHIFEVLRDRDALIGRRVVSDVEDVREQDLSTVMSPRTVITWAENAVIFDDDLAFSFRVTFLNKCEETERPIVAEYYQRVFGEELLESAVNGDSPIA